jgi:hypothetical protein
MNIHFFVELLGLFVYIIICLSWASKHHQRSFWHFRRQSFWGTEPVRDAVPFGFPSDALTA